MMSTYGGLAANNAAYNTTLALVYSAEGALPLAVHTRTAVEHALRCCMRVTATAASIHEPRVSTNRQRAADAILRHTVLRGSASLSDVSRALASSGRQCAGSNVAAARAIDGLLARGLIREGDRGPRGRRTLIHVAAEQAPC